MYSMWRDGVIVIADTLACLTTYEPSSFRTKVSTLPHLNMVFASRGPSLLDRRFQHWISLDWACRDIETVNDVAPKHLRQYQADFVQEHGAISTSEFYLFGFPSGSDEPVHYRYQSKNDFEPERFPDPLFGVVPGPETFALEQPDTLEDVIKLATRIRDENDRGLTEDHVVIGGDLFAFEIRNGSISSNHWHRFPDYDETDKAIVRLHQKREAK